MKMTLEEKIEHERLLTEFLEEGKRLDLQRKEKREALANRPIIDRLTLCRTHGIIGRTPLDSDSAFEVAMLQRFVHILPFDVQVSYRDFANLLKALAEEPCSQRFIKYIMCFNVCDRKDAKSALQAMILEDPTLEGWRLKRAPG